MEVCVDNIQSAINASAGGGLRIELCSALSEGGLTPSVGTLKIIKKLISIPVFVMLRPRKGMDFIYSNEEIESMKFDAIELKKAGADGFVFGILKEDRTVNTEVCSEILKIIKPFPATFHRAFDCVLDPIHSMKTIIELGFSRILTSGQKETAIQGIILIKQLIEIADGSIIIMPGAGINENNAFEILKLSCAEEVHGSARRAIENTDVFMGSVDTNNKIMVTDKEIVAKIVSIINEVKLSRSKASSNAKLC